MERVQQVIDDNKDNMSSGAYLELCNASRDAYKAREKIFCKAHYVFAQPEPIEQDEVDEAEYRLVMKSKTAIISVPNEDMYLRWKQQLEQYGFIYCPTVPDSDQIIALKDFPLMEVETMVVKLERLQ
jgi:hypothetical protein